MVRLGDGMEVQIVCTRYVPIFGVLTREGVLLRKEANAAPKPPSQLQFTPKPKKKIQFCFLKQLYQKLPKHLA